MDSIEHLVIFRNVKEHYVAGKPIICQYSVPNISVSVVCNDGDCYVGIFRVGWERLQDAVARKSVTLAESCVSDVQQIAFSGLETPESNANEFYQFCFFNEKEDCTLGASGPFQITSFPENDSYVRVENESAEVSQAVQISMSQNVLKEVEWCLDSSNAVDGDIMDAVLVHNRTTMLENALAKMVDENTALKSWKVKSEVTSGELRNCIESLQSSKVCLQAQVNTLEDKIFAMTEAENAKIVELQSQIASLREREVLLSQSLSDLSDSAKAAIEKLSCDYEERLEKCYVEIQLKADELSIAIQEKCKFEKLAMELNSIKVLHEDKFVVIGKEASTYKHALSLEKERMAKVESEYQEIISKLAEQVEELTKQKSVASENLKHAAEFEIKLNFEQQKNKSLCIELENLLTLAEDSERKHMHEYGQLKSNFAKLQTAFAAKCESFAELIKEKCELIDKMKEMARELEIHKKCGDQQMQNESKIVFLTTKNTQMQEELLMNNSAVSDFKKKVSVDELRIKELEGCVELLELQVVALKTSKEMKSGADSGDTVRAGELVAKFEEENKLLKEEILHLKNDRVNLPSSDSGSHHALQVATAHLQKQLSQLKQELRKQKLRPCDPPAPEAAPSGDFLRKENEDLKVRLCLGRNAYKSKHIECQQLKLQIRDMESVQRTPLESHMCEKCKNSLATQGLLSTMESEVTRGLQEKMLEEQILGMEKLESRCKVLELMNEKLQDQLQTVVSNSALELKKLEEGLEVKNAELKKAHEQNQDLVEQLSNCGTDDLFKLKETVQSLEKENQSLKRQKQVLLRAGVGQNFPSPRAGLLRITEDNTSVICSPPSSSKALPVIEKQPEPLQQVIYRPPSYARECAPCPTAEVPALLAAELRSGAVCAPHPFPVSRSPHNITNSDDTLPSSEAESTLSQERPWPSKKASISPSRVESPVKPAGAKVPLPTASPRSHYAAVALRSYCPVCNIEFASGATDEFATRHVNSHFGDS